MPIEYVPEFDQDGNHIGGYTQSVPETYVKEEPDCYTCDDSGCGDCDPTRVSLTKDHATVGSGYGMGHWGAQPYSEESPF
ncbi:hypothetical protein [Streptomyces europaeiscabiei]|uniref:hypothetical protein n=1 Tax=Streptomyces europaeiscabiei TaxID=146819 RepID=UPI0029A9A4D9|nr:hypothetical protein [Streptomyces europaeiscabiei]MDX3672697.1 hypothetical protein [Streptomyces europaeiscabiei]